MSRTKASFSHLQRLTFEGCLARKLGFHIFNLQMIEGYLAQKLRFRILHFQILKDVSHESFGFTTSTFTF